MDTLREHLLISFTTEKYRHANIRACLIVDTLIVIATFFLLFSHFPSTVHPLWCFEISRSLFLLTYLISIPLCCFNAGPNVSCKFEASYRCPNTVKLLLLFFNYLETANAYLLLIVWLSLFLCYTTRTTFF